jgi:hypothetical protein
MASAAGARPVGETRPFANPRKKRRAKATRGTKRVISSSQWSLTDLMQWYARANKRVNQTAIGEEE